MKSTSQMKPTSLKAERELRGWSQSKIAELLGTTTKTVGRWERGEAVPYPHYREQLCTLFGKNAQQLGWLQDTDEDGQTVETQDLKEIAAESLSSALTEAWLLEDPVILQAKRKTNRLLGRYDLLTQVKHRLFAVDDLTLMALNGLPGIGKTALAVAIATDRQVQDYFGDGILWAGLGPHPNVLGQLMRWGALLGVIPSQVENVKSPQAWGQALRVAIGTRRLLLIIDDAWTAEDALALQVGGPACAHLLTTHLSQVAYAFAQQEAIVIPPLEEADGLALLACFIPQIVQQDPEGARALVRAVNGLPLALTLMGKYLACQTLTGQFQCLQTILVQLHETEQRLLASRPSISEEQSPSLSEIMPLYLHAAIAICDQHLSPDAHAALCALSIFASKPDSFSKEAALKVSQRSIEALDELLDAGLLESWGPERYTLHQTVADYACAQNEALEDIQIRQQEPYASGEPLSLQGVVVGSMRGRSKLPFRMHSSWLPLITLSTTILATLAMIVLLLAFTRLPSSSSLGQATNSPVAQSPLGTSYEAEAPENTLTGDADVLKCSSCSGGRRMGNIGYGKNSGESGTLQFNRISEKSTGDYVLSLYYISGNGGRVLDVSVNGGPPIAIYASSTKKWSVVRALSITVHLNAGYNTIKFFNPLARGPDIDCIVV